MSLDRGTQEAILDAFRASREEAEGDGKDPKFATNDFGFPWTNSIFGSDGRSLYIHERSDRPGSLRVRWQVTNAEADARDGNRRPRVAVPTPTPIRNERGILLKRSLARAEEAAKACYERWLIPPSTSGEPETQWTLYEMLELFVDRKEGKAFSSQRWRDEMVGTFPIDAAKKTQLAELDRIVGLRTVLVSEWNYALARKVWTQLADESTNGGGYRKAEMMISTVYSAANHARRLQRIPEEVCISPPQWRAALKAEWVKRTGVPANPARPRYSRTEASKITSNLTLADPRLALALTIGTGYRVQQIAENAKRSHINKSGRFGLRLSLIDQKKGATTHIDLTPRQQRALRVAMDVGFLSKLEEAFEAGEVEDYFLIPGARFRKGKAETKNAGVPLGRRTLSQFMTDFEKVVGVKHAPGRLFHGLRRAMESIVAEHTTDSKARDLAGGWTVGGGTRESRYADAEDEETLEIAVLARAAAIESIATPLPPTGVVEELTLRVQQLKDYTEAAAKTPEIGPLLSDTIKQLDALMAALEQAALSATQMDASG